MNKITLLLPACIALAACGAVGTVENLVRPVVAPATRASDTPLLTIQEVQETPRGCSLSVRFGSYAMGIDTEAAQRVEALLTSQTGVESVSRYRWGKEGEYTLCATTRTAPAAVELFDKVRPLVPAKPRGPVLVALAGGRSYTRP